MKGTFSRGRLRGFVVIALAVGLLGIFPSGSGAQPLPPKLICTGAGALNIIANPPGPGANQWQLAGVGSCQGDNEGTYFADIVGVGTSDTLGLCDGGSPFVQNLEIDVTLTLKSTSTGLTKVLTEMWGSPLTTFPYAVPFLITDNAEFVGAGNIFTRIGGQCPPMGNPAAQLSWSRVFLS